MMHIEVVPSHPALEFGRCCISGDGTGDEGKDAGK